MELECQVQVKWVCTVLFEIHGSSLGIVSKVPVSHSFEERKFHGFTTAVSFHASYGLSSLHEA